MVSGWAATDSAAVLFCRCVHREPGREVDHHVRGGILPLLLEDEAARRRGQASRKGEAGR